MTSRKSSSIRNLLGKVALVTGSGRNIGRATILELAARGANVVTNAKTNYSQANSVAEEARQLGVHAIATIGDVAMEEQVSHIVSTALREFGQVDILINNAGVRPVKPFIDMTLDDWRYVNGVNLDGPFFCCKEVIPGMVEREWGRIINVSGLNAFKGQPNWAHVCASKMGALGMTRALSTELATSNILVNHVVPGAFDTSRDRPPEPQSDKQTIASIPVGRLGLPEEVAKTCAFLASDEASFITGQTIHVNGGAFTS